MATKNVTTLPTLPPHVVIFPFMAQGHTIPLLDLSKSLSRRGLLVTIITTPSNSSFIQSHISNQPTLISLTTIPFPQVPYLPKGCENTSALPSFELLVPFINATKVLKQPFEDILRSMSESNNPPICVVSDSFLSWTLDSCNLFSIPRIVSHGMGVLPMLIMKYINLYVKSCHKNGPSFGLDNGVIEFPFCGFSIPFGLTKADFPPPIWDADLNRNEFLKAFLEFDEADVKSWGVLVNSFEELEKDYIPALEDLYVGHSKSKAWCVGPLLLCNINNDHMEGIKEFHDPCIRWLEECYVDAGSSSSGVLYVSFGTQAHLGNQQMDEIAFGLEMAGQQFIWVVRSSEWVPPVSWEERVKSIGLVCREWVDQRCVLAHPRVNGFLTQCGWNSVLEGLTAGIPLLAWPMVGEQPLNAKYVSMGLGVGIMIPLEGDEKGEIKTVDRGAICDAVKELMRGEQGRKARERARELGELARQAVVKGGSSDKNLDELVACLTSVKK